MLNIYEKTPKRPRRRRKVINDDTMRAAMQDHNNKNIIGKVLVLYQGLMSDAELESCGLHALWKTLQYHDASFGQKFTTNLHRFTQWECQRELRRQKNEKKKKRVSLSDIGDLPVPPDEHISDEDRDALSHIRDAMNSPGFSIMGRAMITEHFFDQRTMEEIGARHGMSKEAVRQKLDDAIERLRELTKPDDWSVYSSED